MSERKETPDVLGEILGATLPPAESVIVPFARPVSRRRPSPAAPAEPVPVAAEPDPPLPATQWEYLQVIFHDYDGWRPRSRNGEAIAGWKRGADMLTYLNELGGEGWELGGIAATDKGQIMAIFKRAKS